MWFRVQSTVRSKSVEFNLGCLILKDLQVSGYVFFEPESISDSEIRTQREIFFQPFREPGLSLLYREDLTVTMLLSLTEQHTHQKHFILGILEVRVYVKCYSSVSSKKKKNTHTHTNVLETNRICMLCVSPLIWSYVQHLLRKAF